MEIGRTTRKQTKGSALAEYLDDCGTYASIAKRIKARGGFKDVSLHEAQQKVRSRLVIAGNRVNKSVPIEYRDYILDMIEEDLNNIEQHKKVITKVFQ